MDSFNFDEWAALAKTAPDEFEQQRLNVIECLISNSGKNYHRLQGLQCSIELERIRARNPLKACLRLSTLMSDAHFDLNAALNTYVDDYCIAMRTSFHFEGSAKIFHVYPNASNTNDISSNA